MRFFSVALGLLVACSVLAWPAYAAYPPSEGAPPCTQDIDGAVWVDTQGKTWVCVAFYDLQGRGVWVWALRRNPWLFTPGENVYADDAGHMLVGDDGAWLDNSGNLGDEVAGTVFANGEPVQSDTWENITYTWVDYGDGVGWRNCDPGMATLASSAAGLNWWNFSLVWPSQDPCGPGYYAFTDTLTATLPGGAQTQSNMVTTTGWLDGTLSPSLSRALRTPSFSVHPQTPHHAAPSTPPRGAIHTTPQQTTTVVLHGGSTTITHMGVHNAAPTRTFRTTR
jgi:hypothetical protein